MNSFLALAKRDIADHRGSIVYAPLIMAGIFAAVILLSYFTGHLQIDGLENIGHQKAGDHISIMGHDNLKAVYVGGKLMFDDGHGPKRFFQFLDAKERWDFGVFYAMVTSIVFVPMMLKSMFTTLFSLSSTLYEERRDRSILFWKSLPVTDLKTVISRFVVLPFASFGMSFLAAAAVHILLFFVGLPLVIGNGFMQLNWIELWTAMPMVWSLWAFAIVIYVLWAAPLYGWCLAVSAFAPKAPFIIALAPLALVPLFAGVVGFKPDFMIDPLYRIIGAYVIQPLQNLDDSVSSEHMPQLTEVLALMSKSFTEPSLWIGLFIAFALVYLAADIRKRRTL